MPRGQPMFQTAAHIGCEPFVFSGGAHQENKTAGVCEEEAYSRSRIGKVQGEPEHFLVPGSKEELLWAGEMGNGGVKGAVMGPNLNIKRNKHNNEL